VKEQLGESVSAVNGKDGIIVHTVAKERLFEFMKEMKEKGFDSLSLITGVDRKDYLEVVYHLHNFATDEYVEVKTTTDNGVVPSLVSLWSSARWDEREEYDLMGIKFEGHENLKRIFLPENWVGHPLRKDYNLKNIQYINMDKDGEDYATFDPGDGW
jgi:NADH-quinone oxidoreductase subunit C